MFILVGGGAEKQWQEHPKWSVWAAMNDERSLPEDDDEKEKLRWLRSAEVVGAMAVTRYVDWVLKNLRRTALLIPYCLIVTSALMTAVPFPFRSLTSSALLAALLFSLGSVFLVTVQASRNEVLSRIGKTEPGKFTWDRSSLIGTLVFLALPILAFLGTEVPWVSKSLFNWTVDFLKILGGF
jgi:hypothetical protein